MSMFVLSSGVNGSLATDAAFVLQTRETRDQGGWLEVNSLPPEVLSEIFLRCIPSPPKNILSSQEPPLLLAQVCSHWRNVAISTPRLWSIISINLYTPRHSVRLIRRPHPYIERLQLFLSRSRCCLLSISLSLPSSRSRQEIPTRKLSEAIIDIIAAHRPRWRKLVISHTLTHNFLPLLSSEAPNLQVLDISPCDFTIFELNTHLFPALERLVITASRPLFHFGQPERQTRITSADVGLTPNMRDCLQLLSLSPLMREFTARLNVMQPLSWLGPELLCLHHLTSLNLTSLSRIPSTGHPGPLLDRLLLPSLCKLSIQDYNKQAESQLKPALSLIQRSKAQLSTLSYSKGHNFEVHDDLVNVLKHSPDLKILYLDGKMTDMGTRMVDALKLDNGKGLVPRLKYLTFRSLRLNPDLIPAIASMILSRCWVDNVNGQWLPLTRIRIPSLFFTSVVDKILFMANERGLNWKFFRRHGPVAPMEGVLEVNDFQGNSILIQVA